MRFEDLDISLVISLDKEKWTKFDELLKEANDKISEKDKATFNNEKPEIDKGISFLPFDPFLSLCDFILKHPPPYPTFHDIFQKRN